MKLYVYATCYVCNNKLHCCHACNNLGYSYIEASDKSIAEYLSKCDEQQKEIFLDALRNVVDYI
jgi:hypothetical protein